MKKRTLVCFFIILSVALAPRAIELFSKNNYFGAETGLDYLITKKIVYNHELILIGAEVGGIGGFSKGPGWNYLLSVPFWLSQGHPYAEKVLMFVLSVCSVLLAFIVTHRMFNLKTAVLISSLMSMSPYLIYQSSIAWPPFVIPILVVIFLYFLFKAFSHKGKYLILVALMIGIMSHFEIATAGTLFLQFLLIGIIFLFKKKISLRYFLFSIIVFLITLLPIFVYDLGNNFYNTKGVLRMIQAGKTQVASLSRSEILSNRIDTFNSNFLNVFTPHRIVSPLLFIPIYLGVFFYLKNKANSPPKKLFVFYLSASPIFMFFVFLFYPGKIDAWWLIELTVFYCFLIGILLGYYWQKALFKVLILIVILSLLKAFIYNTYLSYQGNFAFPPSTKLIKQLTPIDYIYSDAKEKPFKYEMLPLKRASDDFEYLFWWRGLTKYKKQYNNQIKSNLSYLIAEVDNQKPGNYKKLFSEVKEGSVIETKKLGDYYFIQKRIIN